MLVAVTSQGVDINSQMDQRFGRASHILIVDSETMEFKVMDNQQNSNLLKGAGIQTSVNIKQAGAEVLMTGFCGPNTIKTLNASKIKVITDVSGSVKEAMDLFNSGNYKYSTEANAAGHSM